MRRLALSCILSTALISTAAFPVIADQASFEQAVSLCIGNAVNLVDARYAFNDAGWSEADGYGPDEYQYALEGSQVYLNAGDPVEDLGCSVMDETVSVDSARDFMVETLDVYQPDAEEGTGFMGITVWRLNVDGGTLVFKVSEDFTGAGAKVFFEFQHE